MADEESQVQEDTSWWAFDAFADSELPSMSIDEPLEWPDSLPWEEFSATPAPLEGPQTAPPTPADLLFPADAATDYAVDPAPLATPDPDLDWQAGGYDTGPTVAATPLAGLGGASGPTPAHDTPEVEPLPESIWSYDGGARSDGQVAGLATLAAPLAYADTDGRRGSGWPRRLNIRRGNVAVVALISAASLVLLGMFLSVRSRNDLPTDATGSPPRTDQIATANTRSPLPTTSVVTTTVPGPVINIADLVPATEGTAGGAGASTAGAAGTGSAAATPVATTAPARSSTAPAGGASTGTTQPAAQSTETPAAPEPPPAETTTPTSPSLPPADDRTVVTSQPRTTTSFTMPSIPDYTIPSSATSVPPRNSFSFGRDN